MARDDDEALRWEGDDDATLAPGWKRVGPPTEPSTGSSVESSPRSVAAADDAVASPTAPTARGEAAAQPGSAELVVLGVFGGIYLLFSIGWLVTVLGAANAVVDPVGSFMFGLGLALAVLAPGLWFGVASAAARGRARLVWLLVGAIVLAPIPFLTGGVL